MKLRKYASVILAICISLTLIAVTAVSMRIIYAYDRANVSHHLLTRLQATTGLIELWQQNYLSGVEALAQDPGLVKLVDNLINQKISPAEAGVTMDQWLRPIYLARGYEGHSIIDPNYLILLSSSPNYTGKPVVSTNSRNAIGKAIREGKAIGLPTAAVYQISVLDKTAEAGTLYQLACARINKNGNLLAVLCLRQDPYHNFFAMLNTGFSGTSGEAYAVDRSGYIVSPTRFGQAVIRNKTTTMEKPSYVKGLQARVPSKTKNGVLVTNPKTSPITKGVSIAMAQGNSNFVDGYLDYRGVEVVGTVKWLPEMDLGIVVEQDADEVYAPFQFFSNAIIGFTILAIVLINILMLVMARGRRSLAEREQSMRAFLDNFPGLAHMRDIPGRFLVANKQMEDFLQIPRAQIIGNTEKIVHTPSKYVNQLNADHEEVIRTGQVVETIKELVGYTYNTMQWMKTIRFPIFNPESHEIYAVGTILMDISEQTRNAQELDSIRVNLENMVTQRTVQLETAKLEAEQAARAKSDFLANMSHEIRTPMNAIIGLSHLATLVSDDPKLRSYLERIHQSSTHLLSIINDILDFSKIEAGKMTIEQVDFSLEEMLDNVLGLLWDRADTKGLELLLDIDNTLPDNLKGDALRIGQILINFTSNAVKFTETGNVLVCVRKISDSPKSVRVRFEVQDTGIGIPSENFNQLFKPFHQLDTSSTRRFEGTGLGLTISKNLVELMGGELDFHSQPGEGSSFSVELDLAKGAAPEASKLRPPQGKRVLVVDDNTQARAILTKMLNDLELDVASVDSAAAALTLIELQDHPTQAFDIIFLDWKMPELSGLEAAEQIHNLPNTQQTKFVLLSAHNKHDISPSAENLFAAIISKPVLASVLRDTVTKLFKNKHTRIHHSAQLDLSAYQKLAGSRILLVDDNDINQDVVKELLGLVGVEITTAGNGQQALALLEQSSFDMVLMDVQMPIMDGMEATRRLRAQERFDQLPIIAMTAGALAGDRERCLSVGMNDYISKPIYPEILYRILLRWHTHRTQATTLLPPPIKTEASAANTTRVLSRLYRISGLDVDQALERLLNNETLYLKLITRFIQERSNIVDVIEAALIAKNIHEASSQAHSFKSLAGTIGAVELQALALQIELELNQEKDVQYLLQSLRVSVHELLAELRDSLSI